MGDTSGHTAGMEGYGVNPYGDRHAGVYDDWYGADGGIAISQVGSPEDVATAVADLAAGGAVLELGVGTGRLALPIADRGLDVTGLDASSAMLDVLRANPGAERLTLVEGDMACPDPSRTGLADGSFSLVLIGFNTLFNLTSEAAQVACVTHVARLLRPGGRFVLEAFVPDPGAHDGMSVRSVELNRVLLDVTVTDLDGQVITGQRIEITEAGNRLFPYHLRYATPAQIDSMAGDVGLVPEHRWAAWSRAPFTDDSGCHVSVWRKPGGGAR